MVITRPEIRSGKLDKPENWTAQAGKSHEHEVVERIQMALQALPGHCDLAWLARKAGIPASTFYENVKRGISKTDLAIKVASVAMRDAALAERLGLKLIPEVEITYSLGGGSLAEDYPDSKMVPFRQDWLDRLTRGFKPDVFLARGQGDSMMPTILDDDDVLVNRADNVIRQQDRIWALGYGELGMIKRVRRLPTGLFQLNSDNPAVRRSRRPRTSCSSSAASSGSAEEYEIMKS
jgi:hypothetical protein